MDVSTDRHAKDVVLANKRHDLMWAENSGKQCGNSRETGFPPLSPQCRTTAAVTELASLARKHRGNTGNSSGRGLPRLLQIAHPHAGLLLL